ncbi:hypothetical protein ACFQU7_25055 [Pseudoroseomonas wenyumeiae]
MSAENGVASRAARIDAGADMRHPHHQPAIIAAAEPPFMPGRFLARDGRGLHGKTAHRFCLCEAGFRGGVRPGPEEIMLRSHAGRISDVLRR